MTKLTDRQKRLRQEQEDLKLPLTIQYLYNEQIMTFDEIGKLFNISGNVARNKYLKAISFTCFKNIVTMAKMRNFYLELKQDYEKEYGLKKKDDLRKRDLKIIKEFLRQPPNTSTSDKDFYYYYFGVTNEELALIKESL